MDRRIAVSEFLTLTSAPAIARPELSLTLPEIVPPATCARQALPVTSAIAVTHATVKELEFKASQVGLGSISTILHGRIRSNASPPFFRAFAPALAGSAAIWEAVHIHIGSGQRGGPDFLSEDNVF